MAFHVYIEFDGATFGETNTEQSAEIARILRRAADRMDPSLNAWPDWNMKLFDANGNKVGYSDVSD